MITWGRMEQMWVLVQEVFEHKEVLLHEHQHVVRDIQLVYTVRAVDRSGMSQHRDEVEPYPGRAILDFQRGRTRRAKYNAKPSRRPLKVAVPDVKASPSQLSVL